ncbi:MAG: 50S ribosomal protein L13 [Candidatus Babeliaceae bacterium]|nr:50S ribosomal protein L13 [Candidatus Babeliaceae bacterium]
MNKTFFNKKEEHTPQWHLIDASGKIVGRLATEIADLLRGRNEPTYTPHGDCGNYVVVINADKLVFTGAKADEKEYVWYTGWRSGQKRATVPQKQARDHEFVLRHAVKGMLPRNKQANKQIDRLKIYANAQHPHAAQITGFPAKKV